MKRDKFNLPNAKYDIFVNGLYNQVNTNQGPWVIDASVIAAILVLLSTWNLKWAISKNRTISTSTDRENTNLARTALTAYLRPFVQKWIYLNTVMTDADVIACGLDPHDRTKTKVGKPESKPEMTYQPDTGATHQLKAFYKQQPDEDGVSLRRKPDGVAQIKVAVLVLVSDDVDDSALDPDTFPRMVTGSRSPIKVSFAPADTGKRVALAACYVTKTGIQGDWTTVQVITVP